MGNSRRDFLKSITYLSVGAAMVPGVAKSFGGYRKEGDLFFDISLAEWSLNKSIFNGKISHLDFPVKARKEFDIGAVEYVNQFFKDKAGDKKYLDEMKKRCDDHGVKQLLIMVDGEGDLATPDKKERTTALENHFKWVEAARYLGCHSIRVNLYGKGSPEDMKSASIDSLARLSEFSADHDINILVENHGGQSSDASWLSGIMRQVDRNNCGTLPDFGNFCLKSEGDVCIKRYDRYKGVREMMPYAGGVSAKSYAFDDNGDETTIDFRKMLNIVKEAGFRGHIGIEYEGSELSEEEGILATKELLLNIGKELRS